MLGIMSTAAFTDDLGLYKLLLTLQSNYDRFY